MRVGDSVDEISRRTLRRLAGLTICIFLLAVAAILLKPDRQSQFLWSNSDFSNYWIASRLVLEGKAQDLFSGHAIYFAHMQRIFGEDFPWHAWSYPPNFLLIIWPLATMDFNVSMIVFLLVTLLLYLHAVSTTWKHIPDVSALFLVPFIVGNALAAQNGFLTAALLLYGLSLRDCRPVLAGVAIGLLTIKPQLGILLPLLLLAERRWMVFISAAITTLAVFILSVWFFGLRAWAGYIVYNWNDQTHLMNHGGGIFIDMMVSTFGAMRRLGYDAEIASYIHAAVALAALLAFLKVVRRHANPDIRSASLVYATFLISPYALFYDLGAMVALGAFGYTQTSNGSLLANAPSGRLAYCVLAALPIIGPIGSFLGFPIIPIVLAGCWWLLARRQRRNANAGDQSILSIP